MVVNRAYSRLGSNSVRLSHPSRINFVQRCIGLWVFATFILVFSARSQSPTPMILDPLLRYERLQYALSDSSPSFMVYPVWTGTDSLTGVWSRMRGQERLKSRSVGDSFWGNPFELSFYTPELLITNNSTIPFGHNDGGLWQGVGLNQHYSMGVGLRYGAFRVSLRPQLTHVENRYHLLSPYRPPSDINRRGGQVYYLDVPTRPGRKVDEVRPDTDTYATWYPGESFVQVEWNKMAAGVSTQQRWIGPAVYNPLLLSTNAPGFLHGYVSSINPVRVYGGHTEFLWFWGGLRESKFFDQNPDNDLRFISGFNLTYSPDLLKGLHLGMARVGYKYYNDRLGARDLFLAFERRASDPVSRDPAEVYEPYVVMDSYFFRHVLADAGFEWYMEYGVNSFRRFLKDRLTQSNLNRAYTIGSIKRFRLPRGQDLALLLEHTQLENNSGGAFWRDRLGESGVNIWYVSDEIRQGYTHQGKILGAGIGPGSSSQTLSLSWYHGYGNVELILNRVAYHNDRLFKYADYYLEEDNFRNTIWRFQEMGRSAGLSVLFFLPYNLDIQVAVRSERRLRYENVKNQDLSNTHISFSLKYAIRQLRLY